MKATSPAATSTARTIRMIFFICGRAPDLSVFSLRKCRGYGSQRPRNLFFALPDDPRRGRLQGEISPRKNLAEIPLRQRQKTVKIKQTERRRLLFGRMNNPAGLKNREDGQQKIIPGTVN